MTQLLSRADVYFWGLLSVFTFYHRSKYLGETLLKRKRYTLALFLMFPSMVSCLCHFWACWHRTPWKSHVAEEYHSLWVARDQSGVRGRDQGQDMPFRSTSLETHILQWALDSHNSTISHIVYSNVESIRGLRDD